MPTLSKPRINSWMMSEDLIILMYSDLPYKRLACILPYRSPDAIKQRRSQLLRREPPFLLSRYNTL